MSLQQSVQVNDDETRRQSMISNTPAVQFKLSAELSNFNFKEELTKFLEEISRPFAEKEYVDTKLLEAKRSLNYLT